MVSRFTRDIYRNGTLESSFRQTELTGGCSVGIRDILASNSSTFSWYPFILTPCSSNFALVASSNLTSAGEGFTSTLLHKS